MICCKTMMDAIGSRIVNLSTLPQDRPAYNISAPYFRKGGAYQIFFCPFCGRKLPEEFETEPLHEQGQWFVDPVSDIEKRDPCDRSDWIQPVLRPEEYKLCLDTGCDTVTEGQGDGTDVEEQGP